MPYENIDWYIPRSRERINQLGKKSEQQDGTTNLGDMCAAGEVILHVWGNMGPVEPLIKSSWQNLITILCRIKLAIAATLAKATAEEYTCGDGSGAPTRAWAHRGKTRRETGHNGQT